jgi:hypothetical protein
VPLSDTRAHARQSGAEPLFSAGVRRLFVVFSLFVLVGCGGSSSPSPAPVSPRSSSALSASTTCGDYLHHLSEQDRQRAAEVGLTRLRTQDGLPTPSPNDVDEFEARLDGACEASAPRDRLTVVAANVYLRS